MLTVSKQFYCECVKVTLQEPQPTNLAQSRCTQYQYSLSGFNSKFKQRRMTVPVTAKTQMTQFYKITV